jgi:hypothetical protein
VKKNRLDKKYYEAQSEFREKCLFGEDSWKGHVVGFHRSHVSYLVVSCSRFDAHLIGGFGSAGGLEPFNNRICRFSFCCRFVPYPTAIDSLHTQVASIAMSHYF